MPPIGDCMYLAVAHQLSNFPLTRFNMKSNAKLFRTLCANYILNHYHDPHIRIPELETYREIHGNSEVNEQLVVQLVHKIQHNSNYWGKKESLIALTNCRRMKVNVFSPDGSVETYLPHQDAPLTEINLFCSRGQQYSSIQTVRAQGHSAPLSIPSTASSNINVDTSEDPSNTVQPRIGSNVPLFPLDNMRIGTWNILSGKRSEKILFPPIILDGF